MTSLLIEDRAVCRAEELGILYAEAFAWVLDHPERGMGRGQGSSRSCPVWINNGVINRPDEESQIAAFLAKNGVTTSVDWGVHQKIVDAAHSLHFEVFVPVNGQGRKRWWLNGAYVDTKELYKRVNAELERRHMKLVAMPKDVA